MSGSWLAVNWGDGVTRPPMCVSSPIGLAWACSHGSGGLCEMNRKYARLRKAQNGDDITSTSFLLSKQVTRAAPIQGTGKETPPRDEENFNVASQEVRREGGNSIATAILPQPVSAIRFQRN